MAPLATIALRLWGAAWVLMFLAFVVGSVYGLDNRSQFGGYSFLFFTAFTTFVTAPAVIVALVLAVLGLSSQRRRAVTVIVLSIVTLVLWLPLVALALTSLGN
jgi:hypothetical protein